MYVNSKKVLAIMAVYDCKGVVDNYIVYYLNSLRAVADRIIAVVNGCLDTEGKAVLGKVVNDIYVRPNRGFDFGAYKDAIEKYLQPKELEKYQELILCNDTCFGPFVPFEAIFREMDRRRLEFWSINYRDNLLLPYYESYFLVFREKALCLITDFLNDEVDSNITKIELAQGYEHSLSELIMQRNICAGYYTSGQEQCSNLDIYKAPDYAIKCLGLPFLKKRCFSNKIFERENCYRALANIQKNTEYPIEYIISSARRNYGLDIQEEDVQLTYNSSIHTFWEFYVSHDELVDFCRNHKKVYLYGKGYMAVFITARFKRYMNEFGGYIVSDECYSEEMHRDEEVFTLSKINKDTPIIVALLEKNSKEVFEKLKGWTNVLFLSIPADKANRENSYL